LVNYPYNFINPELFEAPPKMGTSLRDTTVAENACRTENNTDCRSYYVINIDPKEECTLNGKYSLRIYPACRNNDPLYCDNSKLSTPINVTAKLQSENFCSEFVVDVGITASIKSYSDSNFTDVNAGFIARDRVYFKSIVTSDAGSNLFERVNVIGVILVNENNVTDQYVVVENGNITSIGRQIEYQQHTFVETDSVGFSYSVAKDKNPYTYPPKNGFTQFTVKATLSVDYASKKRAIMQQGVAISSADAQTMLVFAPVPDIQTLFDYILLAFLLSIGGAIIVVAIIFLIINGKVILELLENRHATAQKLSSELMNKFQENKVKLQIVSTLPEWIAPWQVPISNKEILLYEKALEKKRKEAKAKGRTPGTNIKLENQFRIAEWILERQRKYREEMEDDSRDSDSSSSDEDGKKKIKKRCKKFKEKI